MCGRYSITIDKSSIERRFNAKFATGQQEFEPTYNAAPSQLLPIIRTYAPDTIEFAKWGFVPEWATSTLHPQNNARLETAAEKPMFKSSFAGRHCLVITDGFYEWHTDPKTGRKQPYRVVMKSGEPFAMAGIYARTSDHGPGEAEKAPVTFAILTTEANEVMKPIHDRMPVILPLGKEKDWLPPVGGVQFFQPFPAELMTAYPVTSKMNRASFNDPQASAPLTI